MKRVGKPVFFIVVVLIAVLTYLSFLGVTSYYGDVEKTIIKGADEDVYKRQAHSNHQYAVSEHFNAKGSAAGCQHDGGGLLNGHSLYGENTK